MWRQQRSPVGTRRKQRGAAGWPSMPERSVWFAVPSTRVPHLRRSQARWGGHGRARARAKAEGRAPGVEKSSTRPDPVLRCDPSSLASALRGPGTLQNQCQTVSPRRCGSPRGGGGRRHLLRRGAAVGYKHKGRRLSRSHPVHPALQCCLEGKSRRARRAPCAYVRACGLQRSHARCTRYPVVGRRLGMGRASPHSSDLHGRLLRAH